MRIKGLIFVCVLILSAAVAGEAVSDEASPRQVKAAVLTNFPPQYSLMENGAPGGFAVDIIEEIGRIAGFEIEYIVRDTWQEVQDALKSGEADLIPNMGITDRRKQWFAFSHPVETFPVSIFIRENETAIADTADFAGKKVGVVRLNVGEVLIKKYPEALPRQFEHVEDALFDLLSGNTDALIFPEPVLWKTARKAGIADRIRVTGSPLTEIRRAISVAADNPGLLATVNTAVEKLLGSRKYRAIYTRWYGQPAPFWTPRKVTLVMTGVLICTVLFMAFWRYRSTVRLNRDLKEQVERRTLAEENLKKSYDTLEEKVAERTRELQEALSRVKTLSGLLPICAHCKKIRDDRGYWNQIESYISSHSEAEFSHGICSECAKKYYPELDIGGETQK